METQSVNRLIDQFGTPFSNGTLKYGERWWINERVQIALETRGRRAAWLYLPYYGGICPPNGKIRTASDPRSSVLQHKMLPSLAPERTVLRLDVSNQHDLDAALSYIVALVHDCAAG